MKKQRLILVRLKQKSTISTQQLQKLIQKRLKSFRNKLLTKLEKLINHLPIKMFPRIQSKRINLLKLNQCISRSTKSNPSKQLKWKQIRLMLNFSKQQIIHKSRVKPTSRKTRLSHQQIPNQLQLRPIKHKLRLNQPLILNQLKQMSLQRSPTSFQLSKMILHQQQSKSKQLFKQLLRQSSKSKLTTCARKQSWRRKNVQNLKRNIKE